MIGKLMAKKWIAPLVLLLLIVFPFVTTNRYAIYVMTMVFIWSIASYGLNLITGYTGQLNLAHAGFFAIGAYAVGILTTKVGLMFWPALLLACLITPLIGLVIGIISLRLKEHYFAIFTLCVSYIIFLVIEKWDGLTEGVVGIMGIPAPENIGPISFESPIAQYFLVLFFLVMTHVVFSRIVGSLIGRTFIAIRGSEELAQTLGIHLMRNKVLSFVVSTFFAGLAGALYAAFVRFLGPGLAHVNISFDMVTYLLVGGIGTLGGPFIGTFLIIWITQSLQFLQDHRMLVFGPVLVLLVIFFPRGFAGFFQMWQMKRKLKTIKANANAHKGSSEQVKEVS